MPLSPDFLKILHELRVAEYKESKEGVHVAFFDTRTAAEMTGEKDGGDPVMREVLRDMDLEERRTTAAQEKKDLETWSS